MAHIPANERRLQIVDATIHVIANEGLANTTTRRIAEIAGAPLGSLHYAFRSKEEIFATVFEYYVGQGALIYDNIQAAVGLDTAIREVFVQSVDWIVAEPHVHLAQYELLNWAFRTPDMSEPAARVFTNYIDMMALAYHRADTSGEHELEAMQELARLSIACTDGIALQFLSNRDEAAARRLCDHHITFLIQRAKAMSRLPRPGLTVS